MANDNRELGWEDEILNTPAGPEVPDGEYDFIVDHFERQKVGDNSKKYAGMNMAVVYCNIQTDGEPQLKTNMIMHTNFQWKLSQFFISIGQMENEENATLRMNWKTVGGSRGRCRVKNLPNYNDKEKTHPEITDFLPPVANGKKWGNNF